MGCSIPAMRLVGSGKGNGISGKINISLKHLILIVLTGENEVAFIANKCLNSCVHKCCELSELSEIILDFSRR